MEFLRVLFIEDSPEDAELLAIELEAAGFPPGRRLRVQTPESLDRALDEGPWDLIIGDYSLPSFDGMDAVRQVRAKDRDVPYLMISGKVGEELAVEAMRAGANDFLVKSRLDRLGPAVAREMREKNSREERRKAEAALRDSEEHLRQAQRMESVGRLAGGIAHDFNNILSVISGYANLLQLKLARTGNAPRELVEIEKAVVRASALVKQLLSFSRRQVVQKQVLDLGSVLEENLPMLAMLLGEDVRLETSVEPDLPCIHADRSQMEQVIMNLAANARDALPKGGRVTLSLSGCDLDAAYFREGESVAPGPYVKLSVKDDGTGMEEATLGRIFEPFFTTKRDGHGTGLGLSTVYGIVRQAGGTIRVASHRFHGTEFTIHLPVHSAAQEKGANAGAAGRRAAAGGETVLLVEDDQDLRAMTKDLLVLEGYKVLESRDVDEAMGFAQSVELPIDLLLTDIVMPGQNGRDLAESIRLLRPGLRIVFMSGYAPETLMPPGGWPDAGWLDKPFTAGRLLAKVRAALEAPVRP